MLDDHLCWPDPSARQPKAIRLLPIVLFVIIFAACLIGIFTRFDNAMASTWPANAVLLGLFLRHPKSVNRWNWCAVICAYLAADIITGASVFKALFLTLANLLSVWVIWRIYQWLPVTMVRIQHPMSVLYMALACAAGAVAAAIIGGLANPIFFDVPALDGFVLWCVSEYANYIAIVPIMLCAPNLDQSLAKLRCRPWLDLRRDPWPLLALGLSLVATVLIGGPGAIGFSVPALLWCAVRYSTFTISLLTLLTSLWALIFISHTANYDQSQLVSLRLGIPLIALSPIMLSCVLQSQRYLLKRLTYLAEHDGLTGIHNRSAFLDHARKAYSSATGDVAVLMIDIDHFKRVNDQYGHAAGDRVLVKVAARLRNCLRSADLFGRLGGEEFAVLLCGHAKDEVIKVAERMRASIASSSIALTDGQTLNITASIGLVISAAPHSLSLEQLLAEADQALYTAKHSGRNRVISA